MTQILTLSACDTDLEEKLLPASQIIKNGGLVVFPTETVYGLGADATNPDASRSIYSAKGRPSDNPLIIHIATPKDAEKYTYTNELYYSLADRFMPGPLTVVLKAKPTVPSETRASLPTVAVRCPENIIARTLISLSGVPIAAPSANLSGTPSPTTATHVIDDMMGRVDMIIDGGDAEFGLESTIVKIEDNGTLTLLRPGKITLEELSTVAPTRVANAVVEELKEGEVALSPGMKYRHYAPKSPVVLIDADAQLSANYIGNLSEENIAIIAYEEDIDVYKKEVPNAYYYSFGCKGDEVSQAHILFSILREADKKSFSKIYAPVPRREGVGLALYNRMIRASAHTVIKL